MKLVDMPSYWPGGSGSWDQPRIVIITNDVRALSDPRRRERITIVATPLDLITRLEGETDLITIVVLDGIYAGNRELEAVLLDLYPAIRVIDGDPDPAPRNTVPVGRSPVSPAPTPRSNWPRRMSTSSAWPPPTTATSMPRSPPSRRANTS